MTIDLRRMAVPMMPGAIALTRMLIVFQGWAPHPVNTMYDFKYLPGGDKFFGPNFVAKAIASMLPAG
ncbi:hypothetical protein [Mesorhizobium montanum]|uniref:hypothetical protein n=1 Tax=Mesorhizobium montanum TaxID=3072323 RepID=UPI003D323703